MLDNYSEMTPEKRAEALYVVDNKESKVNELINENDTEKLGYCSAKSSEEVIQLNKTCKEISDAADKIDVGKLEKLKDKLQKEQDAYYDSFIKASIEFNIKGLKYGYDPVAFENALNVRDEICKSLNQQYTMDNGFDPDTGDYNKIDVGNVVQFKIDPSDEDSKAIYKYYIAKKVTNEPKSQTIEIVTYDLSLHKNSAGRIIESINREKWGNISSDILNFTNTPYIIRTDNDRHMSVGNLIRAYRTDPTDINSRISKISPKPESSTSAVSIAGIVGGIAAIIAGIILIIVGATTTATIAGAPIGGTLIGAGIAAIIAGIGLIITYALSLTKTNNDMDNFKKDVDIINNIVEQHNRALFRGF
jgi:hypothetical protein